MKTLQPDSPKSFWQWWMGSLQTGQVVILPEVPQYLAKRLKHGSQKVWSQGLQVYALK